MDNIKQIQPIKASPNEQVHEPERTSAEQIGKILIIFIKNVYGLNSNPNHKKSTSKPKPQKQLKAYFILHYILGSIWQGIQGERVE